VVRCFSLLCAACVNSNATSGTCPLSMSAAGTALAVPSMGSHMNMSQRWVRMPYSTLSTKANTTGRRSGLTMLSGAHLCAGGARRVLGHDAACV
jgi:hypothetical protein